MPNTAGAVELGRPGLPRPTFPPAAPRPGAKPKFEALTEKERQALEEMAQANGEKITGEPVVAMFLVLIPQNGVAVALADVTAAEKYDGRPATIDEMRSACSTVTRDIDQARQAQVSVSQQMQMAAAVQRQAEEVALRSKLGV